MDLFRQRMDRGDLFRFDRTKVIQQAHPQLHLTRTRVRFVQMSTKV